MISNPEGCPTARTPKLKAMLELRELKQFHKVFLQNQLCKNLQSALVDLKTRNSQAAHLMAQSEHGPNHQQQHAPFSLHSSDDVV